MYSVTSTDRPREIFIAPQSSVGAPIPMMVVGEHFLQLAYYVEEQHLTADWSAASVRPAKPNDSDELCAVVQFKRPYAHMFGPPNEEAFSGHPLANRGLRPFAVFEVDGSSWLRALVKMNSVHPYHKDEQFAEFRHFVFAFHDTTFECIAHSFSASLWRGSVWVVLDSSANER